MHANFEFIMAQGNAIQQLQSHIAHLQSREQEFNTSITTHKTLVDKSRGDQEVHSWNLIDVGGLA